MWYIYKGKQQLAYTIAITGKGVVGKTTLTGLLVGWLTRIKGESPVLVVDADANSNLNEVLGVEALTTLGDLREVIETADMAVDSPIPASMSKADYLEGNFARALIEEDDYDMLVMGRTQGAGCYCFVNGLLQAQVAKYSNNYKYVVVDNEAGMEHISRGVLPKVDMILLVSDCSVRGVQAAGRIQSLARQLNRNAKDFKLIINRAPEAGLPEGVAAEIEAQDLDLAGVIPADPQIAEYDAGGIPTITLPEENKAKQALYAVLETIL
jgi:CO dehydrogenase maturation factor